MRWPARATSAERNVETTARPKPPATIVTATRRGGADLPVQQDQETGDGDGRHRQEEHEVEELFPASTKTAGMVLRSASAVPVSSSATKARGRPVAAAKKRMIQRRAAWRGGRSVRGQPEGPDGEGDERQGRGREEEDGDDRDLAAQLLRGVLGADAHARARGRSRRPPSRARELDPLVRVGEVPLVVGSEQRPPPSAGRRKRTARDRLAALDVERDHRLVEDEHGRVEEHRERDPQPLFHSGRVLLDAPAHRLLGEADLGESPHEVVRLGGAAGGAAEEGQVLDGRELAVEREVGPGPTHGEAALGSRELRGALALDADSAGRGAGSPARIFSSVVLPLPLLPAIATSPRETEKERPEKSGAPENALLEVFGGDSSSARSGRTIPSGPREPRRRA